MTQTQSLHATSGARAAISLPVLRRRAANHPMAMFAIAASVAILSVSSPWTVVTMAPSAAQAAGKDTVKDEPAPARSEIELACEGQVWGKETPSCLMAIAKDGGKEGPARIRTISGA